MNCAYHPYREAVAACVNCGRLICDECKVVLSDKIYCNACVDKTVTQTNNLMKTERRGWFARHLNWTAFLSWIAFYPLYYFICFLAGLVIYSVNPYISDESVDTISIFLAILVALAWLIPINGWVLSKKGRSWGWLLIFLVPFGWIVFLCLENKREFTRILI